MFLRNPRKNFENTSFREIPRIHLGYMVRSHSRGAFLQAPRKLWILTEKGAVIRPLEVDLEGGQTVL